MRYFDIIRKRKKCSNILKEVNSLSWESVFECNICKCENVTLLRDTDRYGLKLRSGLCNNCGLVYLIDRLTKESYMDFYFKGLYRKLVSAFNEKPITNESIYSIQKFYAENLINLLGEYFDRKSGGAMLDIGGSSGNVSKSICQKYNYSLTILDPAESELKHNSSKDIELVNSMLEDFKVENKRYEVVLLYQTIDHLYDLRSSLKKIYELLSNEGIFIFDIVDFGICCNYSPVDHFIKIDHCYYLSNEIMKNILGSFGFSIKVREIFSNPFHVTYICEKGSDGVSSKIEKIDSTVTDNLINRIRGWDYNTEIFNSVDKAKIVLYRAKKKFFGKK